ncbi:F-box only protein 6-like [Mercenaria mercenaria]|uniref:F-box only protein 6-like n=1 Tax=Mercenaria mercenaria TaxID=6596 RepID=UPI00234ED580|nr:F-box only protein 6-like [Mercenaria mercenaria]
MSRRNKNLLRNPCAEENLPSRSTSHEPCENFQLIYLPEFDISEEILDKKPPIRIRDWYGARNVCGCEYTIRVRLLADDKSTELDVWNFEDTQEECSGWKKVKHVFQDYPPGVRYVEFKHGGQNTKIWTGHYGAKMTNSGVFVGKKRGNRKKRAVREKLGKNLLKNPCAASNFEGWTIVSDGGWACEEKPSGCKPVKEAEGESCWSTSYQDCEKKQVIDLDFEGFDSNYMDEIGPKIKLSEW